MAKAKAETKEEKKDPLEELKAKMEKLYGKGIIVSGTSKRDFEVVSSGSYEFDKATDCGGLPVGKLIEIFGPESSGKSTLSLHIIAEFQKSGRKALLCDYEYSFDKGYAQTIGVNTDELIITQPDTMEDGYNIIYDYIKSGLVGLIVIDSHTAMVPKARMEGEIGDAKMAPEARLNSDALKKIKAELEKAQCSVLGISQLRANIGKMGNGGNVPTGGNAWKFYPDMRIKIYRELDKDHGANATTIEIVKNKCGKPFGKTQISVIWGKGIDKIGEVVEIAVKMSVLSKSGSWYQYPAQIKEGTKVIQEGVNIANGGNRMRMLMEDNPELFTEIKDKALALYKDSELVTVPIAEEDVDKLPVTAITGDVLEAVA